MKHLMIIFLIPSLVFSYSRLYLGPQVSYRDYHEEINGEGKSDEYGTLYGYQAGYENYSSFVYGHFFTNGLFGNTTYDGTTYCFATRSFKPVISKTENKIYNIEANLGPLFRFCKLKPFRVTPLLGYGYHLWRRDGDCNDPSDYDIRYTWHYYLFGLQSDVLITNSSRVGFCTKAIKTINAKSKLYLDNNVYLDLENKWQYSFDLFSSFYYKMIDFSLIGFYRYQPIGQSKLVKNGLFTIQEPPSKTHLFGIKLELGFRF